MSKRKYPNPIKCKTLLNEIFEYLIEKNSYLIKRYFDESILEEKIKKSRFDRVCVRCGKKIFAKQLYFSRIIQDLGNFSICLDCHKTFDLKKEKNLINKKIKFLAE